MALSSDLISEFVKITNDKEETKKETTVYGTTVEYNGKTYVKLDGSDLLTPVSTTTDVKPDERVTVMIKNHTATITGNISSPAARTDDLQDARDEISQFEIVVAGLVTADDLEVEKARIDTLEAENVTIKGNISANAADIDKLQTNTLTVNEKLIAAEGNITKLQSEKIDTIAADAKFATIENLEATDADIHDLEATYGEFASLTATQLDALRADIDKLEAGEITVEELKATFATIAQLDVEKARIDDLEAEVADIDTLMFGSATGSTLQTSFANAVIAQLGDAQIKSAMIENVSASKITAGDIITNNVRVMSEDGKLLISDETIQISDTTRVRVQIGKDSAGDYSINIWDADGKLMFSEGGITDSAIKEAIIRNDMVSDTANIAAHKLDIDSLFEEINGSEKTIKSTRIWLDDEGQTLDVAFESVTTDIEELQNGISSQGTQITAMQGQIAAKIWQTDIESAVSEVNETTDNLSTQYEEVVQEVDGLTATVASHTSEISKKANSSTVTEVSDKVASMETDLSGFKTTVSETYATKTTVDNIQIGGRNLIRDSKLDKDTDLWFYDLQHQSVSFDNGYLEISRSRDESYTSRTFNNQRSYENPLILPSEINGKTYVLSAEFKAIDGVSIDSGGSIFYRIWYGEDGSFEEITLNIPADLNSTEWRRCYATKTFGTRDWSWSQVSIALNNSDNGFCLRNIMLERATKPSSWSPAPEDMATGEDLAGVEARVEIAETSITQTTESINQLATRTSDNEKSISELNLTADSLTTRVSTTETNLAELEIGGRNLVRDSKLEGEYSSTVWSGSPVVAGDNCVEFYRDTAGTSRSFFTQYVSSNDQLLPENGETYTLSIDLKSIDGIALTSGGSLFWRIYYTSDYSGYNEMALNFDTIDITDEWKRFSKTQTITFDTEQAITNVQLSVAIGAAIGGIAFRNIKLEKGNRATDWTPAPEDMATGDDVTAIQTSIDSAEERLSTAESIIHQLSDCISMLVTDGDGQSLMTQTDDGWTFSTGDIQDKLNATSENLDSLTNEVGDIDSAVGILQQSVDDLGVLSEYVKITTYEDEPCIELGETDSDFKLLITNTRIMFMEGTGVPAYITNQALHIKKAVVEEELQQGEFIWKARSNGNLGLIWKGATN